MRELKLTDREWQVFKIGDLFSIENGKCSKVTGIPEGNIPYVGATNRNNGVISFINPKKELISQGNCIVFICDGDGSIGYSIYKSGPFVGTTTIKIGRNKYLNRYTGCFITTISDQVRGIYNFGYKRNEFHLKNERILLPIVPNVADNLTQPASQPASQPARLGFYGSLCQAKRTVKNQGDYGYVK